MSDPPPDNTNSRSPPAPDQAVLPTTFRAKGRWLASQGALGIAFACGGLVSLFCLIHLSRTLTASDNALIGLACLLIIGIGAVCIADNFKSRLVIFDDAIELHGLFTIRRLSRQAIASKAYGWSGVSYDASMLTLFPISKQTKPLTIRVTFERTAIWNAWMSTIPDGTSPLWPGKAASKVANDLTFWVNLIVVQFSFDLWQKPIWGPSFVFDVIITAALTLGVTFSAIYAVTWLVNRWNVRQAP